MSATTQIDTLVHARWILPIIPRNQLLEHHSIAVREGRILDILPTESAVKKYTAKNTLSRKQHLVMPGLINTHAHTPMNLFRGLADDLPLMDWLQNHIWPAEQKILNHASVNQGSRMAIAEMIRGGNPCFSEHYCNRNPGALIHAVVI